MTWQFTRNSNLPNSLAARIDYSQADHSFCLLAYTAFGGGIQHQRRKVAPMCDNAHRRVARSFSIDHAKGCLHRVAAAPTELNENGNDASCNPAAGAGGRDFSLASQQGSGLWSRRWIGLDRGGGAPGARMRAMLNSVQNQEMPEASDSLPGSGSE
jgi:hypothetical protein